MRKNFVCLIFFSLIFLTFCGGKEENNVGQTEQASGNSNEVTEVLLQSVGDKQEYDKKEFTVKAGSKVKLIFKNVATMPAMVHNVVIAKPGADTNKIGQEALKAKDNDFIPDNPDILFYTPLAKPGETVEVEFTAPEPGEYPYVCTYTAHYIFMKGVMRVE